VRVSSSNDSCIGRESPRLASSDTSPVSRNCEVIAWKNTSHSAGSPAQHGTGKPVKLSASAASKPYPQAERAALWGWAAGQPTDELRAGCQVLLTLGLGCGLGSGEVVPLRAHDVRRPGNGAIVVCVRGPRSRLVVCRRLWEGVLAEHAARFDGARHYYQANKLWSGSYFAGPSAARRSASSATTSSSRTGPVRAGPGLAASRAGLHPRPEGLRWRIR
jgi:hypothetical protein